MKRVWILALLSALLLTACTPQAQTSAQPQIATIFAMNTYMELTVYGEEAALEQATSCIRQLETQISVTDEKSALATLNRTGAGTLAGDAAALLEEALAMCERTGGALDLSIYPVVRAWGFTTGSYQVPEDDALQALLPYVDYRQVQFDPETGAVQLPEGMMIDLGSVAKGFAGREAAVLLRDAGVSSALLDLGGNIQTVGTKPDGKPWRISVKNPDGGDGLLVLEIADQAVVTSGGYERYFEQDGQVYWHILDPATGYPARSGLSSVTVVGQDGLVCDALSTALFVMGLEKAAALWQESDDFEAVFVTDTGEIYLTAGLEDSYTLTAPYSDREVRIIER